MGSSKDEDALRRKVAEQIVTIERLERDQKDSKEKLTQLEAHSKKFGECKFINFLCVIFVSFFYFWIQRIKWPAWKKLRRSKMLK